MNEILNYLFSEIAYGKDVFMACQEVKTTASERLKELPILSYKASEALKEAHKKLDELNRMSPEKYMENLAMTRKYNNLNAQTGNEVLEMLLSLDSLSDSHQDIRNIIANNTLRIKSLNSPVSLSFENLEALDFAKLQLHKEIKEIRNNINKYVKEMAEYQSTIEKIEDIYRVYQQNNMRSI